MLKSKSFAVSNNTGCLQKAFVFIFTIVTLFCAQNVFAATLSLSPSAGSFNSGQTVSVKVRVSSNQPINAVSATVNFSSETLSLTSISKSGSIITLWPVDPSFNNQLGQANIEGVVLSGFAGSGGTVATLNFKTKASGPAFVRFGSASVLANDGQGTNVLSSSGGAEFNISEKIIEQITSSITSLPIVNNKNLAKNQTSPAPIRVEEIRSLNNEPGRATFLIIPSKPAKDKSYTIQIDTEEIFSYIDQGYNIYQTDVLENGPHTIRVSAQSINGLQMTGMTEFTINSGSLSSDGTAIEQTRFAKSFIQNANTFLINLVIILAILLIVLIVGYIRIRKNKKGSSRKIQEVKKIVTKSFNILEEDEDEENKLIRKLKNKKVLTEDDEANIDQFSKDISEAEKIITEAVNKIKEND